MTSEQITQLMEFITWAQTAGPWIVDALYAIAIALCFLSGCKLLEVTIDGGKTDWPL